MGIDHTASTLWGIEVKVPDGEEDPEGWLEELLEGSSYSYFTAGSSYIGNVDHAIGIGACTSARAGSEWEEINLPNEEERAAFVEFLRSKGIEGDPTWLQGLHVW